MKPLQNISRRHIIVGVLATLFSAGVALAAMCQTCQGSGTSSTPCSFCKGTGLYGEMKCPSCKGKRFQNCAVCGGSGKN